MAPRDLFHRRAKQNHRVGGGKSKLRAEGEFALARAQFDFERTKRHAERFDAAPDRLQRRVDLIEARFGQILVALIEQTDFGRPRRPGRVFCGKPWVFQLEEMKLDLEPGEEIQTLRSETRKGVAQNLPCRERHRLAVGEDNIAEQPPGMRRPRENLECCRIGNHDEIAAALHFRHVETAAGGEHRIDGLVRGIFGEERRRHSDAACHGTERIRRYQRLAA